MGPPYIGGGRIEDARDLIDWLVEVHLKFKLAPETRTSR